GRPPAASPAARRAHRTGSRSSAGYASRVIVRQAPRPSESSIQRPGDQLRRAPGSRTGAGLTEGRRCGDHGWVDAVELFGREQVARASRYHRPLYAAAVAGLALDMLVLAL